MIIYIYIHTYYVSIIYNRDLFTYNTWDWSWLKQRGWFSCDDHLNFAAWVSTHVEWSKYLKVFYGHLGEWNLFPWGKEVSKILVWIPSPEDWSYWTPHQWSQDVSYVNPRHPPWGMIPHAHPQRKVHPRIGFPKKNMCLSCSHLDAYKFRKFLCIFGQNQTSLLGIYSKEICWL